MSIPLIQQYRVGKFILSQKLKGIKRYPVVLMLEPLFRCNLACAGCGKIDYPKEILDRRMSVEECLSAVDECGAPIVSIPGGEPLIHKEIVPIVEGIIARKKFVYLCTNALLLPKHLHKFTPSPYLTFSIHLDGNRERHDTSVCQRRRGTLPDCPRNRGVSINLGGIEVGYPEGSDGPIGRTGRAETGPLRTQYSHTRDRRGHADRVRAQARRCRV